MDKTAASDGILEILAFAGARAVTTNASGEITGYTPAFRDTFGDHAVSIRLHEIFRGLPERMASFPDGEVSLTFKKNGTEVLARLIRVASDARHLAIVFRHGRDTDLLSRSEQAQIVNASDDLIFQFNASAKVYYVSGNVERITGYRAEDFISGRLHPLDIVHPDDRPMIEKEFNELFASHKSAENSEHRIVKKNGEIAYLLKSWYVLKDGRGTFTGVIGLNKDITKEKLLGERLQLFHSAFEHATDAILITGIDGKIIDVNEAFTRIYGYSRDEAIGKKTSILQSKHSTPDFYGQMWSSLESEGQWRGEIINRRKDGAEIPIWLSITPILMEGKKIGYMGIESDISDRKNLEQQIIQTEKLATIGQLAAGIAHEIGTPLNIISGNAEYALLDMKQSDPGHQELVTIIAQTKRMSTLMRQLLDFARPKVLSLQQTDVNGILTDVLNFIRVQFNKGNISIRTELQENIPKVYGDPALLYQVFLNIIVNSYQAMEKGGNLTVWTSMETSDKEKKSVTIRIEDSGEGIREEHLAKIFTPFFTTKEPGKGTGLGLAVTKRIVQEHNGTIEISSAAGKGTVVTIRFAAFEQTKNLPH